MTCWTAFIVVAINVKPASRGITSCGSQQDRQQDVKSTFAQSPYSWLAVSMQLQQQQQLFTLQPPYWHSCQQCLFTNLLLSLCPAGLDFVFHMFFLVKYCKSLEEGEQLAQQLQSCRQAVWRATERLACLIGHQLARQRLVCFSSSPAAACSSSCTAGSSAMEAVCFSSSSSSAIATRLSV